MTGVNTLRREIPVSYKTTIKTTVVDALRDVFDTQYEESEFQNLHIFPEFPTDEINYPAIYIRYNEGPVRNAGVGHTELFADSTGAIRTWKHYHFEGTLEFIIVALTTLDRDILSDALIELMAMGSLDPALNKFFGHFYGNPTDPYSIVALFNQINLNSDVITNGGDSAGLAPWGPEDQLVFQTSYITEVTGGFYNSIPTSMPLQYVNNVIAEPFVDGTAYPVDDNGIWTYPFAYYDDAIASGEGIIRSEEGLKLDVGTVTSEARPINTHDEHDVGDEVGLVTSTAQITSIAVVIFADSGPAISIVIPITAIDNVDYADLSAVAVSVAVPSAAMTRDSIDSAIVRSQAIISDTDSAVFADTQTVTGHAVPSDVELRTGVDVGTVTAIAVPITSVEVTGTSNIYFDAAPVIGVAVSSATDTAATKDAATETSLGIASSDSQTNNIIESSTITSIAVPSAVANVNFVEVATATSVAIPSSGDISAYVDASAAISMAIPSSDMGVAFLDASTILSIGIPISTVEDISGVDVATVTGISSISATFGNVLLDTATVTSVAVISDVDIRGRTDAATVTSVASSITTENAQYYDGIYPAPSGSLPPDPWLVTEFPMVIGVAEPDSSTNPVLFDSNTVTSVGIVSSAEIRGFTDVNTATSIAIPGSVDTHQNVDAATVTAVEASVDAQSYGTLDAATVTSIAVPSAVSGQALVDASTVTSVASMPATDTHGYIDSATVTSAGAQTPPITVYFDDTFGRTATAGWANGWVVDNGTAADFNIATSGSATIVMPTAGGNAHVIRQPTALADSETVVSFQIPSTAITGAPVEVVAIASRATRSAPTTNFYRSTVHVTTGGQFEIKIEKVVSNTSTVLIAFTTSPITVQTNYTYNMTFRCTDVNPTSLYAKIEDPASPLAANTWSIKATDAVSAFTSGDSSVRSFRQGPNTNTNYTVTYKEVKITSIPGAGLDQYTP